MKTFIYTKHPGRDYEPLWDLLEDLGGWRSQESCWKVPFDRGSLELLNWAIANDAIDENDVVEVIDHLDPTDYVWLNIPSAVHEMLSAKGIVWTPLIWKNAA